MKANFWIFLIILAIVILGMSTISILNTSESLPIEYKNYTSDKYQIQFQYPSNWALKEKSNRFEQGSDISIKVGNKSALGHIGISIAGNNSGVDLWTVLTTVHEETLSNFDKDVRSIEAPSISEIGGHKAGTFVIAFNQKYIPDPDIRGSQIWITSNGNKVYTINFMSNSSIFDTPVYTQIRDHFIKSIKFVDVNNQTLQN
jgi:hypothetical protein